jgi:hypothetical protein
MDAGQGPACIGHSAANWILCDNLAQPSHLFNLGGTLEIILKSQGTAMLPTMLALSAVEVCKNLNSNPVYLLEANSKIRSWVLSLQRAGGSRNIMNNTEVKSSS